MINNFENIKSHIRFINERSFYFIQIIKRKKENPELKGDVKPIETFYIFNIKQFNKLMPHIIELCEENNARAYIKMNCLDSYSVMLEELSIITNNIKNENWNNIAKTLNSACGNVKKQKENDLLYLIDLDNIKIGSEEYYNYIDIINELKPKNQHNTPVYMSVPTKNGCHLLTTGFNIKAFTEKYPDIDIHEDGITLLYFPNSCE